MLVLSRKLGEKIVIGNNITMQVVSISNRVVRSKVVLVLREELIEPSPARLTPL